MLVVALVTMGLLAPAVSASAQEVTTSSAQRVLQGITAQRLTVRLSSGAVARGDVLRVQENDPNVTLRPRLANNTVAGLERFTTMANRELGRGAVAGINGGYHLPRPVGAPNGLAVDDGRLLAGQAVNSIGGGGVATGRGVIGWSPGGPMVMDRVLVALSLERPALETPAVLFDEINRQVWPTSEARRRPNGELLLFDDRFGTSIAAPAGSTIVTVSGLRVGTSGRTEGTVTTSRRVVDATSVQVPSGHHVIVGYGLREQELVGIDVGEPVAVTSQITPEATPAALWEGLASGTAGGQLLVRDGVRRPSDEFGAFAAFGDAHAYARQPRTAIGRTADGRILLVTVDGRQSGWSVGLTVRELADVMIALGARDAVNLDGGGSTTMMIDGTIRNRPSEVGRSVSDGLFLYVQPPQPARGLAGACPSSVIRQAGFVDVPGTTHADAIWCLTGWGVTSGVTLTSYAPVADITRAQMASFLVRWIDDIAERGEGRALPSSAPMPFRDVSSTSAHAGPIARLAAAGVLGGRSATTFAPNEPVTRAQTATLVAQALEYVTGNALTGARDTFVDDNTSTHEGNIDRLAATGIVTGVGGFSYRPALPVTRGAMASVLMRATDALVEQAVVGPPSGAVLAGASAPLEGAADPEDVDAG